MNDTQKKKRNFRDSKKWKDFRKRKMLEQKGICALSKRKLTGRWNLHHLDLDATHYEDLSDPTKYVALNSRQHSLVHEIYYGWQKYGKWDYIRRLITLLTEMLVINGEEEDEERQD